MKIVALIVLMWVAPLVIVKLYEIKETRKNKKRIWRS